MDMIPLTQDVLKLYCLRAGYQEGQIWGRCLQSVHDTLNVEQWAWRRADPGNRTYWEPVWSTHPMTQDFLLLLVQCGKQYAKLLLPHSPSALHRIVPVWG